MTFDKVPTASDEKHWPMGQIALHGHSTFVSLPSQGVALMRRVALALILSSCLAGAAAAQLVPPLNSKPEAYAKPTSVPAARDVPFPGTLQLTVDATDMTRAIFRIRERVPVTSAGDLVMLYPKWVPG